MRQINDSGLKIIKSFESCELEAYKDIVGVVTIGWGHVDSSLRLGDRITQEEADHLLDQDLYNFEAGVESLIVPEITDNQFSALVSFAYNLGLNALRHSTLLLKLNQDDIQGAADEFLKWDHAGGVQVEGLLRRRTAERSLFLTS